MQGLEDVRFEGAAVLDFHAVGVLERTDEVEDGADDLGLVGVVVELITEGVLMLLAMEDVRGVTLVMRVLGSDQNGGLGDGLVKTSASTCVCSFT